MAPDFFVRTARLELAHLSAPASKTGVSTISPRPQESRDIASRPGSQAVRGQRGASVQVGPNAACHWASVVGAPASPFGIQTQVRGVVDVPK